MATMQEETIYQANKVKDDGLSASHVQKDAWVVHDLVQSLEKLEG